MRQNECPGFSAAITTLQRHGALSSCVGYSFRLLLQLPVQLAGARVSLTSWVIDQMAGVQFSCSDLRHGKVCTLVMAPLSLALP